MKTWEGCKEGLNPFVSQVNYYTRKAYAMYALPALSLNPFVSQVNYYYKYKI